LSSYVLYFWVMVACCITVEFEDEDPDLAAVQVKMQSPDRSLRVIEEDEEVGDEGEEEAGAGRDERRLEAIGEQGDEAHDVATGSQGITEEELAALRMLLYHIALHSLYNNTAFYL